ncbi:hypothetical protein OG21DRAFT_1274303 [Imleria badia]|nr:hypothetical protein OG21DRAFT_1274303 [Imleria badia]
MICCSRRVRWLFSTKIWRWRRGSLMKSWLFATKIGSWHSRSLMERILPLTRDWCRDQLPFLGKMVTRRQPSEMVTNNVQSRLPGRNSMLCTRTTVDRFLSLRNDAVPFRRKWKRWISSVVDSVFGSKPASQLAPTDAVTTTPRAPVVNRPTGHNCVICQDPIFGAEIRAPCGHYYGIDCVTDLFQSATRDETLFPPRCCRQNIPLAQVQLHLSQALVMTFQQKQVEFTTLKRVYCSAPTCSHFLGPLSEGAFASKVYTCPALGCERRTCGKCREQHSGDWTHACRPDADAAQVLELGRTAGWARCPGCSQMIELNIGCFHMTCRCRTEFCYLCRARWKNCQCPQWDERRLLAAAEARVDAQLGVGRERGARRDVPAQRANPVPVPANRTPAPGARVPPPLPARRPESVSFVTPLRLPAVDVQPAPTRTPAASTWTRRPANAAGGPAREAANHKVRSWASSVPEWKPAGAATHTGASTSASASTSTSAFASGSRSKSTSTPGPSYPRPKSMHAGNADPMRQRMVQDMMAQLQEDHECDHTRWRYRHGGGVCQTCQHNLPLFLFRCLGCELLVCKRCRFNRF